MFFIWSIEEDKKEEVIVTNWNPGSPAIQTKTENYIAQAVKEGYYSGIIFERYTKGCNDY